MKKIITYSIVAVGLLVIPTFLCSFVLWESPEWPDKWSETSRGAFLLWASILIGYTISFLTITEDEKSNTNNN